MGRWLLLVISDDLPVVLRAYDSWSEARDAGNEFLQNNDIPGKFVGDDAPDEEEVLVSVADSARFAGSIGIYDTTSKGDLHHEFD